MCKSAYVFYMKKHGFNHFKTISSFIFINDSMFFFPKLLYKTKQKYFLLCHRGGYTSLDGYPKMKADKIRKNDPQEYSNMLLPNHKKSTAMYNYKVFFTFLFIRLFKPFRFKMKYLSIIQTNLLFMMVIFSFAFT